MEKKRRNSDVEFIILIAMLMALVALAINMILPAFKDMTHDLGLSNANHIQLSVSLLYLGLSLGQVFFGTLSDGIGRKNSLNVGLLIFVLGCGVSFTAQNLTILIVGQIIQGIGLGAPRVVTVAIVRDRYVGNDMGRIMSFIMAIFALIPTVSPYLGQGVILLSSWRILFLVFMAFGIAMLFWLNLRLEETLLPEKRTTLSFSKIGQSISVVMKNKNALGYTIVLGLSSSAFLAYLNMSQQIFQIQYELGTNYPLYFAMLSIALGSAAFANGKLVLRYGMENLSRCALIVSSTLSVLAFITIFSTTHQPPFWALMGYMVIVLFCFGILVSNLNSLAMKSLGQIAGMGAAIVGALSTLVSIPLAILIGSFYNNSIFPLVGGFAICGSLALVLFLGLNWTAHRKNVSSEIYGQATSQ